MGTYVDAREKTRNNLVNAFWDLYCQKDINKITIKEITDRAGYNRATFYIYFKNAQQVLDYVEEQLYAIMREPSQKPQSNSDFESMLQQVVAQLDKNSRFLCVLLSEHGDPKFASEFRTHLRRQITQIVEAGDLETTVPLDVALDFLIGGLSNCLQIWYRERPNVSSAELVHSTLEMIFHGILHIPQGGNAR